MMVWYIAAAGTMLVALAVVAVVYVNAGANNIELQHAALGVLTTCTTLAMGMVLIARGNGKGQ